MGSIKSRLKKLQEAAKHNPKEAASVAAAGLVGGPAAAAAQFAGTRAAKKAAEIMKSKKKKAKGTDKVKAALKSGKLPKYNKKS
jgi:hypothetical protein